MSKLTCLKESHRMAPHLRHQLTTPSIISISLFPMTFSWYFQDLWCAISIYEGNLSHPMVPCKAFVMNIHKSWTQRAHSPFGLEIQFVPNVHEKEHRNADVGSNEQLVVKWSLKYRESLNQEQKDVEEEVSPVKGYVTWRCKRELLCVNTFSCSRGANSNMNKRDSSPCDICCRPSKRREIWKKASCSCL